MKRFVTRMRKFISNDLPKPLGRWRKEDCPQRLNHKIDLSNEDHCGPCGHYALDKILDRKVYK